MENLIGKKAPKFSAPAVINGNEIVAELFIGAIRRQQVCGLLFLSHGFHLCVSN